MFDVEVANQHHSYRESDTFKPGDEIKVVSTPFGNIGMSICYDVRFPQLYTALREQGADIIVVPAAFTRVTGKAHWEVLLRARLKPNVGLSLLHNGVNITNPEKPGVIQW